MAVFYRQDIEKSAPVEKPDALKETTQAKLDALRDELKKAETSEDKRRIREEILSISRELNRTKQLKNISNQKLAEGKESLDSISASDLMRIDKESKLRRGEFLSKSFLYKRTTDKEGNISEEPSDGKDLKEGDTLFVDFGKNRSANNRIGLGHMLSTDIGYVKVGERIGVRTIINGRVGYYTKPSPDGYIPVFTGDAVTFPTASEISAFEKQKDANLQRNSNQEENDKANDLYIERLERVPVGSSIELNVLTKESYDFWVEKGLSPAQASGLVANEYQESGCNPRAIGDGGKALGIFQWHPDRRDYIRQKTGISIDTASHKEQLEAALWEMKDPSSRDSQAKEAWGKILGAKTAAESAEYFTRLFERPLNPDGESKKRAQMAVIFQYLAEGGKAEGLIQNIAMDAYKNKDIMNAEHCTDWVDKIYLQATGKSVYGANMYFNGVTPISEGTRIGGSYAKEDVIENINSGMHLMLDKPPYQSGKTHSVIALGKPHDGIIEVVSYPNGNIPPKVERYDLFAQGRGDKDGRVLRIQGV